MNGSNGISTVFLYLGWAVLVIVDIVSILRVFANYSVGWGIAAIVFPPGWVIAPFMTGLWLPFIVGFGLVFAAFALSSSEGN